MTSAAKTTRRGFLKTSAKAAAGLALSFHLPRAAASMLPSTEATEFAPNAYIRITPDNVVRLWVTRSEMGQGVRTTLAMMLAEELEADWAAIPARAGFSQPALSGHSLAHQRQRQQRRNMEAIAYRGCHRPRNAAYRCQPEVGSGPAHLPGGEQQSRPHSYATHIHLWRTIRGRRRAPCPAEGPAKRTPRIFA